MLIQKALEERQIPYIIDFGSKEFNNQFYQDKISEIPFNSNPFNCAIEMSVFFQYLKNVLHIDTVFETGTLVGHTSRYFGSLFKTVHTVEISKEYYLKAKDFLSSFSNVNVHFGNSPDVLRQILPSLKDRSIVFYLDAHWEDYWPLLDELDEISKTHRDNCIIVIDDIMVPGRQDIKFDSYNGIGCSYEYVKSKLDLIFSLYSIHYLIPKDLQYRAKLVIKPCSADFYD
jgi:hypothetical protein